MAYLLPLFHSIVILLPSQKPRVGADAWVAPNAVVVGDVLMTTESAVWYGAVVRGDRNKVILMPQCCIKDRAIVDTVASLPSGYPADTKIGIRTVVGAGAIVTSSVLKDSVVIGTGAIVSEGCVIERNSILAAGSVLEAGTLIPANQFWAGNPAKYVRDVEEEEADLTSKYAVENIALLHNHRDEFLPYGFSYVEAEKLGHEP